MYRDSQQNAGLCAHFLKSGFFRRYSIDRRLKSSVLFGHADFAEILVPLSQSTSVSMDQKKQMIGKFLEVRPSMAPRPGEAALTARRWERRRSPCTCTRRRRTQSASAS